MRLTWLLRLYPPSWQRRYRRELQAHLQSEPARLRTAIDLIAGAVDAWRNPSAIPAAPQPIEEADMITASRCDSIDISKADGLRSAAWMIGVALFLTVLATGLQYSFGQHPAIDALLHAAFFIALTISSRSTYLKPYSWAARNTMIGLVCVGWYAFFLIVAFVSQSI